MTTLESVTEVNRLPCVLWGSAGAAPGQVGTRRWDRPASFWASLLWLAQEGPGIWRRMNRRQGEFYVIIKRVYSQAPVFTTSPLTNPFTQLCLESHLHLTFHHLDPRVCQFLPGGYYYQSSVSLLMYERHLGVNGGNCRPQSVLHCSFIDLSRSPCREGRKQGLHEDPHYMTRYWAWYLENHTDTLFAFEDFVM